MKKSYIKNSFNIVATLWISYVFLGSLPYKFSSHPDTQHIFGTIGTWIGGFLGDGIGKGFSDYGAYVIGSFELVASIILLTSALGIITKGLGLKKVSCDYMFVIGGKIAMLLMAGAIFFHLASPLGVEVLHEGESDGGSLFIAAVSVFLLGMLLIGVNIKEYSEKFPICPFGKFCSKFCKKK